MAWTIVLSGFGGQGLLFAGQVLAQAGLEAGYHVSWLPSYGPEMRGGTASCTVIVSDRPIGSPIADLADIAIVLNPPSLARFEPLLAPGGLLVLNDSLIEAEPTRTDIEPVRVRCSAMAREAGDHRLVSIAALGAAMARRPIVPARTLRRSLAGAAARSGRAAVEKNLRALRAGLAEGALVAV